MFICASYKFLKFRMLINSNAKFNVKCCFPTILAVFSTWSCRSTSLPFLLVKKKMFTIEEKIKLLDGNKKTRQSCRQLADQFRIGKTAAAIIIKNEASMHQEYEHSKGSLKRNRKGQFHTINKILYVSVIKVL